MLDIHIVIHKDWPLISTAIGESLLGKCDTLKLSDASDNVSHVRYAIRDIAICSVAGGPEGGSASGGWAAAPSTPDARRPVARTRRRTYHAGASRPSPGVLEAPPGKLDALARRLDALAHPHPRQDACQRPPHARNCPGRNPSRTETINGPDSHRATPSTSTERYASASARHA